jgi:hypothetical protein
MELIIFVGLNPKWLNNQRVGCVIGKMEKRSEREEVACGRAAIHTAMMCIMQITAHWKTKRTVLTRSVLAHVSSNESDQSSTYVA